MGYGGIVVTSANDDLWIPGYERIIIMNGCEMLKDKTNKIMGEKNIIILIVTLTALSLVPLPAHADGWWNTSFQYRKNITIDHDLVDATLTDFPVLVKLMGGNNDLSNAQGNGEDVRFTNSSGTLLAHEIERWNGTSDESEIWGNDTAGHTGITTSNLQFHVSKQAATYNCDSGINDINSANCSNWSTLLSDCNNTVTCDIIVKDGAVLNLSYATIRMGRYDSGGWKYPSIIVHDNGTLNIDHSSITRHDYYYGWRYENGSKGSITNSTVEFCSYNNGFKIETNKTTSLFNVTFDHGHHNHPSPYYNCYALYLNSASNTSIKECTIKTSSASTSYRGRYTLVLGCLGVF